MQLNYKNDSIKKLNWAAAHSELDIAQFAARNFAMSVVAAKVRRARGTAFGIERRAFARRGQRIV